MGIESKWVGGLLLLATGMAAAQAASTDKIVRGPDFVSEPVTPTFITVDMSRLPPAPTWKPGDPLIEIPRQFYGDPNAPVPVPANPVQVPTDPLASLQQAYDRARAPRALIQGFSVNGTSSTAQPNDPTGDVGTNEFVMAINAAGGTQFSRHDKVTGAQIGNAVVLDSLATGGACGSGLGDPIIMFDELANRWVITEFSTQAGRALCYYISSVADLSGTVTWTRYEFVMPAFPDYPKYGVWPDGYYAGANESGTAGNRPLYVMDRVAMLAGQPATFQRFPIPNLAGFGFQMTQPADIAGTTLPPAGTGGLFARHRDDEAHNAGSNNPTRDFIELFEIDINFTTPASSVVTGPVQIPIAEFSSNLFGLSAFEAFPQPSGSRLDPLRETVMNKLTYRNLGTYEVLVGNLVTDLFLSACSPGPGCYPDDTGAVRWFELWRNTNAPVIEVFASGFEDPAPTAQWTLRQEGTIAPEDVPNDPTQQGDRWMAASSVDQSGNIGIAYNFVRQSPAVPASVRYTGRLANDTLGVMTAGETEAVAGTGSVSGVRWGDYNDMGIDPVDGCTFYFVGNYSSGGARTNRIVSFKHDACGQPTFTLAAQPQTANVCANSGTPTNVAPITINVGNTQGFNNPVALTLQTTPTGFGGSFSPTSVTPLPGTSTLQLTATNAATPGNNTVVVRGTSGAVTRDATLTINVTTLNPAVPTLSAPANGATGTGLSPTLTWAAVPQAVSYVVEASTSNTFATTIFSQSVSGTSFTPAVGFPPNTQIFWRVRAINACGTSANSTVFSFTTANILEFCRTPALAIPDNNTTGVTDSVTVSGLPGNVTDVNVRVEATHTWVGDLRFRIARGSPATTANLMTNPSTPGGTVGNCQGDNVEITFDDETSPARPANTNCANATPGMSGNFTPEQVLSAFDGAAGNGTWTLTAIDSAGQDTGTVTRWCVTFQ